MMKFSALPLVITLFQAAAKEAAGQDANSTLATTTNATTDGESPAPSPQPPAAGNVTTIDFLFPIVPGVSPVLEETMEEMVGFLNELLYPNIIVNPIYAGGYDETYDKVVARVDAGDPPAVAVVNINRMVELYAKNAIIPLNMYVEESGGWSFLDDFYPKMFENEHVRGQNQRKFEYFMQLLQTIFQHTQRFFLLPFFSFTVMGWPMMRSTPVLYYNVDILNEAGVKPPNTWEELVDAAKKLTTPARKGLGLPDTWSDWIYGAFSSQAGTQVIEDDWSTVTFDSEGNTNALGVWEELAKDGSIPVPLTPWSDAIADFAAGKFPMLYFTTGGITKVMEAGANFTWNVVYCPAGTNGFGVEQGGGDFHIFNNIPKTQQDAAWELIKFLTSPENSALWSVASGYIAVNRKAYDLELMQAAYKKTPQYLVARDQLQYSHPQTMSENIQVVRKVLNDNLDALVAGEKTVAEAQADGQTNMVAAIGAPVAAPAPSGGVSVNVGLSLALGLCLGGTFDLFA